MTSLQQVESRLQDIRAKTADGDKVLHYLHAIEENTRRMAVAMENLVKAVKEQD